MTFYVLSSRVTKSFKVRVLPKMRYFAHKGDFLIELANIEKGGKNKNDQVASLEDVLNNGKGSYLPTSQTLIIVLKHAQVH